jgi:hypothetical protein
MFSGLIFRIMPSMYVVFVVNTNVIAYFQCYRETLYLRPNQAQHPNNVTPCPERIHHFLDFVIDCVSHDSDCRQVLHKAGIMTFLLSVLKAELGQFLHSSVHGSAANSANIWALLPLIRQLYIRPTWVHSLGDILNEDWASHVWSKNLLRGFDIMRRHDSGQSRIMKHCICCEEEWTMFGLPCTSG